MNGLVGPLFFEMTQFADRNQRLGGGVQTLWTAFLHDPGPAFYTQAVEVTQRAAVLCRQPQFDRKRGGFPVAIACNRPSNHRLARASVALMSSVATPDKAAFCLSVIKRKRCWGCSTVESTSTTCGFASQTLHHDSGSVSLRLVRDQCVGMNLGHQGTENRVDRVELRPP